MANANRSFEGWQESFMTLDAFETGKTCKGAIATGAECLGDINFHSAAIDRLLEHAWLNPELSDGQRKACTGFATRGIELVDAIWATNEDVVARFQKAIENATADYLPFSSPALRDFMRGGGLKKF